MNFRKVLAGKSLGDAHQGRPKPSMHIGNLAVNEPTDQHIRAVPDGAGQNEDFMTSRMSPPAAANGTARDRAGKGWHRSGRCLEHNPVCAHKRQGLNCRHDKPPSNVAQLNVMNDCLFYVISAC